MTSEGQGPAPATLHRLRSIVRWSWITLALLVLQNLVGMYLNLYVDLQAFPTIEEAFASVPALGLHVLNAFAIIATSAYVLARTVGMREPVLRLASLAGLGFVLLAFFSGIEFTFFGQVDAFSFLMEIGFVGIIACLPIVLFEASRLRAGLDAGQSPAGGAAPGE